MWTNAERTSKITPLVKLFVPDGQALTEFLAWRGNEIVRLPEHKVDAIWQMWDNLLDEHKHWAEDHQMMQRLKGDGSFQRAVAANGFKGTRCTRLRVAGE